jgi:hypothetical protein
LGMGGRKDEWDESTRARAMEIAEREGAEAAARATSVPAGTVRSWQRRKVLAEERAKVNLDGLAHVQAEGRAIVEARLSRPSAEVEAEREAVLAERRVRLARLVERGLADWSAAESWGLSSASEERAAARAVREPEGES